MKKILILTIAAIMVTGCCTKGQPKLFEASVFDTVLNGKPVSLYTLQNSEMAVQFTNYGARIVGFWVPAKDGIPRDVVMGFESIAGYLNARDINNGPIVGRYGNRINKGRYIHCEATDGDETSITPSLSINDGSNHLHGGINGFGSKVWDVKQIDNTNVEFRYVSPHGEEGYIGTLTLDVTYTLMADNLTITYKATTDRTTILNPTSHSYFNLHGTNTKSTNSHILRIDADSYTPTDNELIPTGEIVSVEGTPLDFRIPTAIGERIDADFEALKFGRGYDHNWILNRPDGTPAMQTVAEVYEPETGIVMKIQTDQPGLQFYSGNFMDGKEQGKHGNMNNYRSGIALETQHFPDSPNHANFPSTTLNPGEIYRHICVYSFGVR